MAAGPITFAEIEAYRRVALADLTTWEIGLIRRLDMAALAVMAGTVKERAPKPTDPPEPIPVTNTAGIRALFQGLAAKKAGKGPKAPSSPTPRQ